MKTWLLLLSPLLLLVMLACSGCSTLSSLLPTVTTLTPSGGTFTASYLPSNTATLTVPAGAVNAPTALTFSSATLYPSNTTPLALYSISVTGLPSNLLQPATLTLNYGSSIVIGLSPNANIQLYYLPVNGTNWQSLNGTLNAGAYSYTYNNLVGQGNYALVAD